jgi:hypothetical protein
MGNSKKDMITSDPIGLMTEASKLSLQGGGALLIVALGLIYQVNEAGWNVSSALLFNFVIGAILMGVLSVVLKVIDVRFRYKLASKYLDVRGTTDPELAKEMPVTNMVDPEVLKILLDKSLITYIVSPDTLKSKTETIEVT